MPLSSGTCPLIEGRTHEARGRTLAALADRRAGVALLGGLSWWLRGATRPWSRRRTGSPASSRERAERRPARAPTIELRFARHASIAGTITDLRGRPIARAQVCALATSTRLATSDTRRAVCAQSERDGHYRIDELFPVRHTVVASAPGHIPATYHHGEGASRREHVELRATEEPTGIDIQLEGGGVEIHGIVKDLSGGAVEGAQVLGRRRCESPERRRRPLQRVGAPGPAVAVGRGRRLCRAATTGASRRATSSSCS